MRCPILVLLPLLASGCASLTGSSNQPLAVRTSLDNRPVVGAICVLSNDAGRWTVTTPGSISVGRSYADLSISCTKDAQLAGQETVASKANAAAWGNVLLGGGLGYAVDRRTGAGFDYPSAIVINLRRISEALGIAPYIVDNPVTAAN